MSDEAAVGLLGVFLGALITTGVTFFMQVRRERREARGARLVVESELNEATEAIRAIDDGKAWPPGWVQSWSDSWATYRPALALDMPDRAFKKLADAYLFMARLETGLKAGRRDLVSTDQPFLKEASDRVSLARELLWQRRRRWYQAG